MVGEDKIIPIETGNLIDKVSDLFKSGYRLVQIGCTKVAGGYEINYSFDREYSLVTLRLFLPSNEEEVPSISGVYLPAFLYENELNDLFGMRIRDIAIDYKGKFYQTAVQWPFSREAKPEAMAERGPA